MGEGAIISIYDAIKYARDFQIIMKFADEHYLLELANLPEIIQESEVYTVYELKKMLSDKLFGLSSFSDWLSVNVEFLNGIFPQQRTVSLLLTPHTLVDDNTEVFNWSDISFLPLADTPNPFLKNIVLFEAFHNNKKK